VGRASVPKGTDGRPLKEDAEARASKSADLNEHMRSLSRDSSHSTGFDGVMRRDAECRHGVELNAPTAVCRQG
jgi:hypothetical protein